MCLGKGKSAKDCKGDDDIWEKLVLIIKTQKINNPY